VVPMAREGVGGSVARSERRCEGPPFGFERHAGIKVNDGQEASQIQLTICGLLLSVDTPRRWWASRGS
jgi:hypothetical protein